jgi:hypothetical protein
MSFQKFEFVNSELVWFFISVRTDSAGFQQISVKSTEFVNLGLGSPGGTGGLGTGHAGLAKEELGRARRWASMSC